MPKSLPSGLTVAAAPAVGAGPAKAANPLPFGGRVPPYLTQQQQHRQRRQNRKPFANIHTTAYLGLDFPAAQRAVSGLLSRGATASYFCVDVDGACHWVFDFGAIVSWATATEHKLFLDAYIVPHVSVPAYFLPLQSESDYFIAEISGGESSLQPHVDEERDRYIIPSADADMQLALSHALAQSTALSLVEQHLPLIERRAVAVAEYMMVHNRLPGAPTWSASIRKWAVGTKTPSNDGFAKDGGALHWLALKRNAVGSTQTTPDHFWERDRYEPFYELVREHLGVDEQSAWVQARIDQLHPIFSDAMEFRETTKAHYLEIAIIALITVEILAMFIH